MTWREVSISSYPEEGELRPQLLDRFGMACNVATIFSKDLRVELVMNRMGYEADPNGQGGH
jgi:magnesium chelatase subunit I